MNTEQLKLAAYEDRIAVLCKNYESMIADLRVNLHLSQQQTEQLREELDNRVAQEEADDTPEA